MTLPSEGRRDNGLHSSEWGALVDLDPRLSEALLDSLAAEGVPAFVEPAHDTDSYTRASRLPSRPLDRLWVDPSQADLARGVVTSEVRDLTALLAESEPGATAHGLVRPVPRTAASRVLLPPELPSAAVPPLAEEPPRAVSPLSPPVGGDSKLTDDEIFAQIIAGFATELDDPVPRWPVSEDLGSTPPREAPRRRRSDPPVDPPEDSGLPGWVEPEAIEDDGHFLPPKAPRVPRLRLRTLGALVMVVLGLLVLFAPTLIDFDDSPISILLGLLLMTGGAGLLVAWMRDAPPTDSGPDGSVV